MGNYFNERIKLIPNLLFLGQMVVIFIANLPRFWGIHFIYVQFVAALFTFWYINKHRGDSIIFKSFIQFFIIYCLFYLTNHFFTGNSSFKEVINGLVVLPVIPLLLYFFHISSFGALLQFLFVTGYIIFVVLTGINSIDEVTYNSGNYLPYYAMLYSYPYYVTCYYEKKEPLIIVPAITLFVALISSGRGGIIASAALLLFQLFNKVRKPGRTRWIYFFLMVVILIVVLKDGLSENLSLFFDDSLQKFDAYGMESRGRSQAFEEYMPSLINPIYLLLGSPIKEIPYIFVYLKGSPHISWLCLHSRIGIYAIFILFFVIMGLKKLYKSKQFYMFGIFLCLLIAGIFNGDIGGYMVGGDSYLFFIILIYLEYKHHVSHTIYSSKIKHKKII